MGTFELTIGSYDYTGLTNFYTVIADAWADAMGLEFVQTIITTQTVATERTSLESLKALYR